MGKQVPNSLLHSAQTRLDKFKDFRNQVDTNLQEMAKSSQKFKQIF